jgi:hypothetical protein
MYYHSFPQAPCELISGISGACGIPTIVGAYVGREYNSIFLDVFQNQDFRIKASHLYDIADACGVTLDELEVSSGIDDDHLSITLETSCFDFAYLFPGTRSHRPEDGYESFELAFDPILAAALDDLRKLWNQAGPIEIKLPGTEDSEESIAAHEKTINRPTHKLVEWRCVWCQRMCMALTYGGPYCFASGCSKAK